MSAKHRVLSVYLAIALSLLAVAGCAPAAAPTQAPAAAQPAATQAAPAAASGQPITLQIWTGFPELEPFYKAAGEAYKKTHPNVSVEVLSTTLREFEQKLSAALPTGTGPDIADFGPNISAKFVASNLIDPNPANVDAALKAPGAYSQFVVDYLTYNGKTYGVPFLDGSRAALFYNKTMFKEAGIANPPATQEEMMADAIKLTKYDANGNITRSGLSLRLSGQGSGITEKWWFIAHNLGADPIVQTKDGKWHNGYNNDAGRAALKYYIDAVFKNHVDDQKAQHDSDAFEAGNTAMFLRESWVIGEIKQKAPNLDYGVAPMPKGVKWDTLTQPEGVYVTKVSKNAATAWDFVLFATNKDNSLSLTKTTGWLSPRQDVDWASLVKEIPQYEVFVAPPKDEGFYAYPTIAPFDEIITKMADRLSQAFLDKSLVDNPDGIAKVIKDMADETDSILKQNGMYGTD